MRAASDFDFDVRGLPHVVDDADALAGADRGPRGSHGKRRLIELPVPGATLATRPVHAELGVSVKLPGVVGFTDRKRAGQRSIE